VVSYIEIVLPVKFHFILVTMILKVHQVEDRHDLIQKIYFFYKMCIIFKK